MVVLIIKYSEEERLEQVLICDQLTDESPTMANKHTPTHTNTWTHTLSDGINERNWGKGSNRMVFVLMISEWRN